MSGRQFSFEGDRRACCGGIKIVYLRGLAGARAARRNRGDIVWYVRMSS